MTEQQVNELREWASTLADDTLNAHITTAAAKRDEASAAHDKLNRVYGTLVAARCERMRDRILAQEALAEEAAELKRARIMNRAEPGYERKDGKL